MTGFAPTIEQGMELNLISCVVLSEPCVPRIRDRSLQQRLEAGLDRLLRDVERFEETERWDGMS